MWVVQRGKEGGLLFSEGRMEERGVREKEREGAGGREGGEEGSLLLDTHLSCRCALCRCLNQGKKTFLKRENWC